MALQLRIFPLHPLKLKTTSIRIEKTGWNLIEPVWADRDNNNHVHTIEF